MSITNSFGTDKTNAGLDDFASVDQKDPI